MAEPLSDPSITIGAYGPGQCWACTKRFTRGLGIVDATGQPVASLCQWCALAMIDTLTGWEVTQWVVSLYQKKRFAKSWKQENYLRKIRENQAERRLGFSADQTAENTPSAAPKLPRRPFRWSGAK